jgi:hypothetical protein
VLFLAAVLTASAAAALPVRVDYGRLRGVTESFQGYAPGSGGGTGPVAYDGFSVQTGFEHWALVSDEAPCSATDHCLQNFISPLYSPPVGTETPPPTATFSDFLPGTVSFGIRLPGTFPGFTAIIEGASGSFGTIGFILEPGQLLGPLTLAYHDPGGLFRFSITGPAEYDDVLVSTMAPVPLPPAAVLMLLALGGLGLAGRRAGRRG